MSEILKVGDEVRVFDQNRGKDAPNGFTGKVVKVGRKLVTIKYGYITQVFRLETRKTDDAYGHQWYKTPAEVDLANRETEAYRTLLGVGLSREYGRKTPPLELLEALAEVVKKYQTGG